MTGPRALPPRPRGRGPGGRPAAGFTLIEVAILIVIAGIAVLPLAMLFATTSIRSADARSASVAAHLAQAKLEEITADRRSATRGFAHLQAANYPPESSIPAFATYSRSVTVAPDSVFDGIRYRTVSVSVTTAGIPPVTLTTWFTDYR